jgi:hypothetical protein
MKRTHVTFEEFEFEGVTEKVSSLEDIKVGESFICVDFPIGSGSKFPVFERTATGYLRRENGELDHYIREHYTIHRIKE